MSLQMPGFFVHNYVQMMYDAISNCPACLLTASLLCFICGNAMTNRKTGIIHHTSLGMKPQLVEKCSTAIKGNTLIDSHIRKHGAVHAHTHIQVYTFIHPSLDVMSHTHGHTHLHIHTHADMKKATGIYMLHCNNVCTQIHNT